MDYVKPPRLRSGDRVAVVSTSWGGPHVFPHVFDAGVMALTDRFGLRVVEYPTTRMAPGDLAADPHARAADLNAHWLNGTGRRSGRLFAGCIEVLEFLKGTHWWPGADGDIGSTFWDDRIVFLETSEDKPTVDQVKYWLFNYGIQGVFERASGLIIGRARDYTDDEKRELDQMIVDTVVGQFGATDLPIVTNMDFGHTDPQWILPLGITAELDCGRQTFALTEAAVT